MFRIGGWRWPQWLLFGLGLAYLASYLGFVSTTRIEEVLERLAGATDPGLFGGASGRAEALLIVFAFLLLTPPALAAAAFVPMFAAAMVAATLERMVRLPAALGSLLFWLGLGFWAYLEADRWLPPAERFTGLLAKALLVTLRQAS